MKELSSPAPPVVWRRVLVAALFLLVVIEVMFWAFWGLVALLLPAVNLGSSPGQPQAGGIDYRLAALALTAWAIVHLASLVVFLVRRGRWQRLSLVGIQVMDIAVIGYLGIQESVQRGPTGPAVFGGYGLVPVAVIALLWLLDRSRRATVTR